MALKATFDYSRTLRSRRQVSFGFSAGYSRVETETAAADRAPDNRTTGSARLSVDLGRTWSAHAAYRRGLRYVPGVAAPVFSDDAQAGAAGLDRAPRGPVVCGPVFQRGDATPLGGGYDSVAGTAQVRWAMSRQTALTGSYIFTRYAYPTDALLPPGLDSRFNRQAFRVGVELWLPLYR